ncbi:hypothetical protein [Thermogymnomonas acidicola]|uniref:hypothetical protein n=1 Tax=Thermogymnomonas acidicola TaxID=399579 RepID=UPI000946201B|nr:hypothetical protein [Thermogymnomonas acidicola]
MSAGRQLKLHLQRRKRREKNKERFQLVSELIPEIARKAAKIAGRDEPDIRPLLVRVARVVLFSLGRNGTLRVINSPARRGSSTFSQG